MLERAGGQERVAGEFWFRERNLDSVTVGPNKRRCRSTLPCTTAVPSGMPHSSTNARNTHTPRSQGRFWERVARQEDVAVVTQLRDLRTSRTFVAAATHLHWAPQWPDVKLAQDHLLCSAVGSFLDRRLAPGLPGLPPAQRRRMPALVLGDLNSLPLKIASDAYDKGMWFHFLVYMDACVHGLTAWAHRCRCPPPDTQCPPGARW